jgi:N-ethylmaleimide reductase
VLGEGSLKAVDYARMIERKELDFTGFARAYISNPDLAERLAAGQPISQPDMNTTYSLGAEGYTDYPAYDESSPELSVLGATAHDDADALLLQVNI